MPHSPAITYRGMTTSAWINVARQGVHLILGCDIHATHGLTKHSLPRTCAPVREPARFPHHIGTSSFGKGSSAYRAEENLCPPIDTSSLAPFLGS